MDHDELIEEAERIAEGMKQGEMIKQAFIFGYVANAELRSVLQELKHYRWILYSVLAVLAVAIIVNLLT